MLLALRLSLFAISAVSGLAADWLTDVGSLLTREERQAYQSLPAEARPAFEAQFWSTRRISAEEYYERLASIDQQYGGQRHLSGLNTDQGRLYLSLGKPDELTQLASSRIFYPIQIWRYRQAAGLNTLATLQFLFYQPRGAGNWKLYSPTLDTIRALLTPQSSARGMFGTNDLLSAADIRNKLTVSPNEEEVLEAAVSVARGVTGVENEQILARALSPRTALQRPVRTEVVSRFVLPGMGTKLQTFLTWAADGTAIVDIEYAAVVKEQLGLRVVQQGVPVEEAVTQIAFAEPAPVRYRHRLWLLPGRYTLFCRADRQESASELLVPERPTVGEILVGASSSETVHRPQPFQFGDALIAPALDGQVAFLQAPAGTTVRWRLTQSNRVLWSADAVTTDGTVIQSFGNGRLPAGEYMLEAVAAGQSRRKTVLIQAGEPAGAVLAYRVNLASSQRALSLGQQHLRRHDLASAERFFKLADPGDDTTVALAKVEAMRGNLDASRSSVQEVLTRNEKHAGALALMGYIEAQLQDYVVAARYYRAALAVQPHAALREALQEVTARAAR